MTSILNLTQHPASPEQVSAGVVEPADKDRVRQLLTFGSIPSRAEMLERAAELANIAVGQGADSAMIGGAPFFMSTLESALKAVEVRPIYAFSVRESVETTDDHGKVVKRSIFKHVGFVEV